MRPIFLLAGWVVLSGRMHLNAQCELMLIPDQTFLHSDISTQLSYLAVIDKSNYENHKQTAKIKLKMLIAKALLDGSGDFENFSEKREELFSLNDFHYSSTDTLTFFTSRLPEGRAAEYTNCLKSGFRGRVVRADELFVQVEVEWKPPAYNPTTVSFERVFLNGGAIVGALPKLPHSRKRTLNFSRTTGMVFRFNADVGGETATFFVPAFISIAKVPQTVEKSPYPVTSKFYRMQSLVSGKVLTIREVKSNTGRPPMVFTLDLGEVGVQTEDKKVDDRMWQLLPAAKLGDFYIQYKPNKLFLRAIEAFIGGRVRVDEKNSEQVWTLTPAEELGYYYVQSHQTGFYLDVLGGSLNDGAWVVQAAKHKRQVWRFVE